MATDDLDGGGIFTQAKEIRHDTMIKLHGVGVRSACEYIAMAWIFGAERNIAVSVVMHTPLCDHTV